MLDQLAEQAALNVTPGVVDSPDGRSIMRQHAGIIRSAMVKWGETVRTCVTDACRLNAEVATQSLRELHERLQGEAMAAMLESKHQLAQARADIESLCSERNRLAREIDVAMHGEADAARQASLCDLVPLAQRIRRQLAQATQEREDLARLLDESTKALECRAEAAESALIAQREELERCRACVHEMVGAMRAYEMEVEEPAPYRHRDMMERAEALIACIPTKSAG